MNKLIKELAEQAKCYADENSAHYLQNPHWIETFEEKFAELIVKECVDIASKYDEPKMSGPGLMIGHMIEQHFGVEE